jgi:hypothetical protein
MPRISHRLPGALLVLGILGAPASAQPPAAPAAGQLTIERVEQGFVVAPDARVTEVDGRTAALAGGYAGWMTDRRWLVGAGGYWLANNDDDLQMAYGGLVAEWLARSDQRIGFGVRGLVGGGRATLGSTLGEYFGGGGVIGLPVHEPRLVQAARLGHRGGGRWWDGRTPSIDADTAILVREYFFVVEPQASVVWHFARWARLDVGVGYRLTAGAGALDEDLRGASASVAVQFGGARRTPQP